MGRARGGRLRPARGPGGRRGGVPGWERGGPVSGARGGGPGAATSGGRLGAGGAEWGPGRRARGGRPGGPAGPAGGARWGRGGVLRGALRAVGEGLRGSPPARDRPWGACEGPWGAPDCCSAVGCAGGIRAAVEVLPALRATPAHRPGRSPGAPSVASIRPVPGIGTARNPSGGALTRHQMWWCVARLRCRGPRSGGWASPSTHSPATRSDLGPRKWARWTLREARWT